MALQCSLVVGSGTQETTHQLKLYREDCLLDLTDDQIESVREYGAFDIVVESDSLDDGFFELPELEDYDIQNQDEFVGADSPESYRFNQRYCIYANSWQDKQSEIDLQTVPLTPGYYTVRITMKNGDELFAYWYVEPKELTTPEWEIMRDDVENIVKGLAVDYSRQMRSRVRSIEGSQARSVLDDDTAFLVGQESRIRYAVETLRNEAKYQISKAYTWTPAGSKNEIDQQTIRKIGERPDKRGMLYTPRRYLKYDVAANKWLKLFLIRLVEFCGKQIAYNQQVESATTDEYNAQHKYSRQWNESERAHIDKVFTNNIAELRNAGVILKKMQEYLRLVLEDAFIKTVSMPSNTALPKALMLNASYNLLYRVYVVLFQRKERFTLARSYRRYWKKTAQLYEIWTFVHVLQSLIRQGFEPNSGWVYDTHGKDNVLPFLKEGTQVSLSSDELIIHLTYNEAIPTMRSKTSVLRPLTTVSDRNKPDIRIDVFDVQERYWGSILCDAKYIKLINILNKLRFSDRKGLREQFTAYVNMTSSPFLNNYRSNDYLSMEDMRPVRALLVLYPSGDSKEQEQEESRYTGSNVRYVQARPGEDEAELDNLIAENIRKIHSRSEMLKAFELYNSSR